MITRRTARRRWAWPLVPLYAAGLVAKDRARTAGLLPTRRLQHPVLSVGSLSAGGAGKTPVVIALAALLREHGFTPDILSRGYGRASRATERVDPALPDAAQRFGDEPTLLATRTAEPVYVGASRYDAGSLAEQASSAISPLHLLDDGFQHRQLARAMDIVLVTADDLDDALLPAGNRREPLSALRRADAVVVRAEEREALATPVRALLRPDTPIWIIRRRLAFPAPLFQFGAGLRPLAFCAIARPEAFAAMLTENGCGILDTVLYPDHHSYTAADIDHLLATAKQMNASGFVTTEKDGVKLAGTMREQLAAIGPLMVVSLDVDFGDPKQVLGDIRDALAKGRA